VVSVEAEEERMSAAAAPQVGMAKSTMLGRIRTHGPGKGRKIQKRWLALGAAFLIALGALIGVGALLRDPAQESSATGEVAIGGPFRLLDQNGQRVSNQDFAGQHMLIYFGYTFCPDICPLTLANMSAAMEELPPEVAEQVVPIFITVDPGRDTVEQLAAYASSFDPRLVALTGSDAEVKAAARAYRVYFKKAESESGDDYLMDHTSFIYLMGPDGGYETHFGHNASPEAIAEGVRREVAGS
jgi:cytochrome oxidase Cu insertion factor (SCO1/SenC/PrrC family)